MSGSGIKYAIRKPAYGVAAIAIQASLTWADAHLSTIHP